MLKVHLYILIFLLAISGCSQPAENSNLDTSALCHILVFRKEKKIELWKIDSINTFLDSFPLKNLPQLPLGEYVLDSDTKNGNLKLLFPNKFHESKRAYLSKFHELTLNPNDLSKPFAKRIENIRISKIIVFPNDNRLGGTLTPCFACPHWMAELYSFLNLKKKEYI